MNEHPETTQSEPLPQQPGTGAEPSERAAPPVTPVLTKKQAQRVNSSVTGMLIATGLSLALILPVVLLVPQKKTETFVRNVDVAAVATQAAVGTFHPAAPAMPEGYTSNHADYSDGGSTKVRTWTVGYVTPSKTYMQFIQTDQSNDTWLAQQTKGPKVDSKSIDGLTWDVYSSSNDQQTWVASRGGSTYLVSGEASDDDKQRLAAALAKTGKTS